jgi:hypothetical protein
LSKWLAKAHISPRGAGHFTHRCAYLVFRTQSHLLSPFCLRASVKIKNDDDNDDVQNDGDGYD